MEGEYDLCVNEDNNKPKIAVIGAKGFPAWGGAARANEALFTRLKKQYDVTVYAIDSHAIEQNYQGIRQIIFRGYANKKLSILFYYVKSLLHSLFKGDYDLIHINHRAAGFLVPLLKLRYSVILNVRGMAYNHDNKWKGYEKAIFKISQWFGFRLADQIVTVQKGSVKQLEQYNPGKVIFIPNGVEDYYNSYGLTSQKMYDISFSAARITYLKGLHLLFIALNEIQFKGAINVIGDLDQVGEYKRELLQLSKSLNCNFTGLLKNKEELFNNIKQSKIFIFPSYSEGMSNMLLEAASIKVPVIASDIPQNTDVFSDDDMLFFKCGDSADLKTKISWAFDNYNELVLRAENAYRRVKNDYNWDNIAFKYDEAYKRVLNNDIGNL